MLHHCHNCNLTPPVRVTQLTSGCCEYDSRRTAEWLRSPNTQAGLGAANGPAHELTQGLHRRHLVLGHLTQQQIAELLTIQTKTSRISCIILVYIIIYYYYKLECFR